MGGKCSSTVDSIKDVTVKVEQGSSTSQGGSMSTSGILCGSSSINSCSVGPTGDTNLSSGIPSQEQISVAQVKQEPFYSAPVEGTFLTSGINPIHIRQEEGNCSILPSCISSVCFSLPTSCNSGMPHFLPNSCFLTTVPGTSNFFPTHSSESVLPLMTSTTIPTFSPPVSLDMGNAALPHFNQAFH
ncbi:uncharacterized protein LOC143255759 [Tachypleus tridentatus]|uniref:uncharacterized protein LOC143255759 n=1 Tax=Tachypleus tridentatus TaxID=6853 RepID=UPI003FCEE6CA